ncbi:MAG: LysM peptidoglycan-binding domain-containing protein [Candidatus Tectimicrobiota bacterium]
MPYRRSLGLPMLLLGMTVLAGGWSEQLGLAQTAMTVSERDISGAVIATQEDRVAVSAGDTVLLDQGRAAGVEVGDRYVVFQEARTVTHPYSGREVRIPREVLGELSVVDVHERTSRALVLRSAREVNVGALVAVLRPARQTAALTEEVDWRTQAQSRLQQLGPCLETSRQAVQVAEQRGVTSPALGEARQALARAELALEQASTLVAANEHERALHRLETGLTDCLRAEDLARRPVGSGVGSDTTVPSRYAVQRGDTLWGISGQAQIYHNPLMWPLIYKANSTQIRDPDLIFPQQIFVVPREYTPEEAAAAMQRARQRGAWRQGDHR